ncbi:MAG: YraN family protein [Vulcanimicrobiota bacterium]
MGKTGENLACRFLEKRGFEIVERNYRTRTGEIDIIARHCEVIVFIEVKTRATLNFGLPEEAVDIRKQEQIRNTAFEYMYKKNFMVNPIRFDVISIFKKDGKWQLRWFKQAF